MGGGGINVAISARPDSKPGFASGQGPVAGPRDLWQALVNAEMKLECPETEEC